MENYVTLATEDIQIREPNPKCIKFMINHKELLSMSEDGIKFNHADFPHFLADDFTKEFVGILERIFKCKFTSEFDPIQGYLQDNVTVEKLDHPIDIPS